MEGGVFGRVVSGEQPILGRQAWGPSRVLTCLLSQAPALQQYRASAGSPANQSPTSPVSNQGFSPGSSPQVRDAASPLPAACTPAPASIPLPSVLRTPHSIPSRPLGCGGEQKALLASPGPA